MNNWDILGISPTTDKREIRKAYGKMLAKYHPEEYPDKFIEINRAYKWAIANSSLSDWVPDSPIESDTADFLTESDMADLSIESDMADFPLEFEPFDFPLEFDDFNWTLPFTAGESIFTTDDTGLETEEKLEAEKHLKELAQSALEDLKFKLNAVAGAFFHDSNGLRVLRSFTAAESFKAVKRNPYFIEGLTKHLPTIRFSNKQVKHLKNALGMTKNWDATRLQGHIGVAMAGLNTQLDDKILNNSTDETKLAVLIRWVSIVILVTAILMAYVLGGEWWFAPSPPPLAPQTLIDIIGEDAFQALMATPAPRLEKTIEVPYTQQEFEAYVRTSPDAREAIRISWIYELEGWLYQELGLEATLQATHFSFIYWGFYGFQRVRYTFAGETDIHYFWLQASYGL